ncbi:hypothetical protein LCGC14_2981120, partial [marine sediment metagenome]
MQIDEIRSAPPELPTGIAGEHMQLAIYNPMVRNVPLVVALRLNPLRDVRRIMKEDEYKELFPRIGFETENTEQFRLTNTDLNDESKYRGFYRSAGVGVGITGMGADIFVIDDPVKDAQEAQSLVLRDSTWHWYSSTGYSRLEPGGGILLIMTRW